MRVYARESVVRATPEQVFRYSASRVGFCEQFPYQVKWLDGPEYWDKGDILDFSYRVCGVWLRHRAEVIHYQKDRLFVDRMLEGMYGFFKHTHEFEPVEEGVRVRDTVEFSLGVGDLIDRTIGMITLDRAFNLRHQALKRVDFEQLKEQ